MPKLTSLPENWEVDLDYKLRIFYRKHSDKEPRTYEHPMYGKLPGRWIFQACETECSKWTWEYYNRETEETTQKNPRTHKEELQRELFTRPRSDAIHGSLYKPKPRDDLSLAQRQDIGDKNIRDDYVIIKTLDPSDGSKGALNARIFVDKYVVRVSSDIFTDAFFNEEANIASLYVEFCDLGDLADLIIASKISDIRMIANVS
ncbi:hypothetical protein B0O99DRAFT_591299 [Bisporella sp. PMI_857]|nr:hypothetical protein B0O99DRAFT_591299 [Bisporella sp. PMI_857]